MDRKKVKEDDGYSESEDEGKEESDGQEDDKEVTDYMKDADGDGVADALQGFEVGYVVNVAPADGETKWEWGTLTEKLGNKEWVVRFDGGEEEELHVDDMERAIFSEKLDKGTGRPYYKNTRCKNTVWELPKGAILKSKEDKANDREKAQAASKQKKEKQEEQQKEETKAKTDGGKQGAGDGGGDGGGGGGDSESGSGSSSDSGSSSSSDSSTGDDEEEGGEFYEKYDEGTKRNYYINTQTKETVWELPKGARIVEKKKKKRRKKKKKSKG
jgi:hypothetical protein